MSAAHQRIPRKVVVAAADPLRRFEVFGAEAVTPVIDSQDVDGGYAIWLHEAKPGVSPPRHIHHRKDEIFYLLEGRLLLRCDGKTADASPGDTVVLPKGVPHTWLVTSATPAKLMALVIPGGLVRIFDRMAGTGTGHDVLPEDAAWMMEEFGLEFVGPLLEASAASGA